MKTAALIPFKRFSLAKRRLREGLPAAAVEELGRALLCDVLQAVRESPVSAVFALTEDAAVAEEARAQGARVILDQPDPGLNASIESAERRVAEQGFEASLVVLGDLPLLTPREVEAVIEHGRRHPVVIVPAIDRGTAMLWRRPPGCIPSRFGPDSARAHQEAAQRWGIEPALLTGLDPLARADLDTLEDARRLVESGRPSRAATLLRRLLT